LKNHFKRC